MMRVRELQSTVEHGKCSLTTNNNRVEATKHN